MEQLVSGLHLQAWCRGRFKHKPESQTESDNRFERNLPMYTSSITCAYPCLSKARALGVGVPGVSATWKGTWLDSGRPSQLLRISVRHVKRSKETRGDGSGQWDRESTCGQIGIIGEQSGFDRKERGCLRRDSTHYTE
eukprot:1351109-Amorphochlora_amoeboformis.AAC.1